MKKENIEVKRITKEEVNTLFQLLYRLDDHLEVYCNNNLIAMQAIQLLNSYGLYGS